MRRPTHRWHARTATHQIAKDDVRTSDGWKYVYNLDTGQARLNDLASDPGETTDLASIEPARAAELDQLLRSFIGTQLAYYADRGWEQGHYPPRLP